MNTQNNRTQGSALAVVLVFAISIGVIIASVFRYSMGEARVSHSNLMINEARLAAESAVEHGMFQLNNRFLNSAAVAPDEFDPFNIAARPLVLTDAFYDVYGNATASRVVLPDGNYDPSNFMAYGTAVVAGRVPALPTEVVVDRAIPGAELSAVVETMADVIEVQVYGKATVRDAQFGERTAFARQRIQVLDESIFRFGIFFEGDLTIAPGPTMSFSEDSLIHSNGNIFLRANNTLRVPGRITAGRDFYAGAEDGRSGSGTVLLRNPLSGDDIDLRNVEGVSGWFDSTTGGFRAIAETVTNGNLQTREHDVQRRSAPGFEAMRDMFDSEDGGNFGYHMIMPPAVLAASTGDGDEANEILNTVEQSKLSTRSGMTLNLSFDASGEPVVTVLTHARDALTNQPIRAGGAVVYEPVVVPPGFEFWTLEQYEASGSTVVSGLFDLREGADSASDGQKSLVRIDMEALTNYLHASNDATDADGNPLFGSGGARHPSEFYNGGIFINMPQQSDPGREDLVVPAIRDWAVDLFNGETVPNPDYLRASATSPAYGMTLVTNGGLYVTGNFNVPDGAGDKSTPGDPATFGRNEGAEAAVALVADSVTLLSNNWDRSQSRSGLSSRKASDTIFSAAIISGNVYGEKNEDGPYYRGYSGGFENFPRFLEDWSGGRTATIRGSFINLFQSEVQTSRWGSSGVYNPPNREWGHNLSFLEETRPPLFLGMRGYRRVFFEEISEREFIDGLAVFYPQILNTDGSANEDETTGGGSTNEESGGGLIGGVLNLLD